MQKGENLLVAVTMMQPNHGNLNLYLPCPPPSPGDTYFRPSPSGGVRGDKSGV